MKKYMILILSAMIIFAGLFGGCANKQSDDSPSPTELVRTNDEDVLPEDMPSVAQGCLMAPTVVGTVLEVKNEGKLILVDAKKELDEQVEGEIWVAITDDTYFFEDVEENSSLGDMKNVSRDFKVGNKVVFHTDAIAESYPMQTNALSVYENSKQ